MNKYRYWLMAIYYLLFESPKAKSQQLRAKNGFTLIEILITISILAIITVVSIPNLKKFSQDQVVTDTSSDLLRVLKLAKSSSTSNIKCSNKPATSWKVSLNSESYTLVATCFDSNKYPVIESTTETFITTNYASKKITITSSANCGSNYPEIVFSGNLTAFKCLDGSELSDNKLILTLVDNKGNPPLKINIDKGGALYESR